MMAAIFHCLIASDKGRNPLPPRKMSMHQSSLAGVLVLVLFLLSLAACGSDKKDETPLPPADKDPDREVCYGDCWPEFTDGDPDEEILEEEEEDVSEVETESDIDVTEQEDNGSEELEAESETELTENTDADWSELVEGDYCVCNPKDPDDDTCLLLGENYYCGEDCQCHPGGGDRDQDRLEFENWEPDLEEGQEVEYCKNGMPTCTTHEMCPPHSLCEISESSDGGCCSYEMILACDMDPCPTGWFCNIFSYCEMQCVNNKECESFDCGEKGCCCTDDGRCKPVGFCDGGDTEESEIFSCASCEDCRDNPLYGENYYCNIDSNRCTPFLESEPDPCCDASDCVKQPNGYCDFHKGGCYYVSDPLTRGSIDGTLWVTPSYSPYHFGIELRNSVGDVVEQKRNLALQQNEDVYYSLFRFTGLTEQNYYLFGWVEDFSANTLPYPFNPVIVNFDQPQTTTWYGVDFYVGLSDPRLATVSGAVTTNGIYETDSVVVELLREDESGILVTEKTLSLNARINERTFSFTNINSGRYYIQSLLYHGIYKYRDYDSKLITITLDGVTGAQIEGQHLYYGYDNASLGSVQGTLHFPPYLAAENLQVSLFDINYPRQYPVARAEITPLDATSANYYFPNIEEGNYLIAGVVTVLDYTSECNPYNNTADIELNVNNDYTGRDIYIDSPNPDLCSISGKISYPEEIKNFDFAIEVYSDAEMKVLLRKDLVLYNDQDMFEATFFVENLEDGTYYLKATATDGVSNLELPDNTPFTLAVNDMKDVQNVSFIFTP